MPDVGLSNKLPSPTPTPTPIPSPTPPGPPVVPLPPNSPLPPDTPAPAPDHFFTREQRYALLATLVLFGLSVLGSLVSKMPFAFLIYGWYLGAGLGLLTALVSFVDGIVQLFRGRPHMILSSIVILLMVVIVGFGTCAANLSLISASSGPF